MSIISYKKYITNEFTRALVLPADQDHKFLGTELATIGDTTYVFVPDGATLPSNQPAEIVNSIETVTLTDTLREQIKAASPHCKLISQRVIDKIRERYSLDDEQYFSRIGIGKALNIYEFRQGEQDVLLEFGVYVEECRQWGKDQRAVIGL